MKYITVLDFEAGRVFQYKAGKMQDCEEFEDYLSGLGHNLANCEWMVHSDPRVITD